MHGRLAPESALQRLGAWVEPVLVAEWARLIRSYGERMSRPVASGQAEAALVWIEPVRDTQIARTVAGRLSAGGRQLECVWTGVPVTLNTLDIDHCMPWSAWPCGDLWNLLPASSRVNQLLKRDRLPSAFALATARPRIMSWWSDAWLADAALGQGFKREVAAALPVSPGAALEDVFSGLEWRRLRLRQDQQVPEWRGLILGTQS